MHVTWLDNNSWLWEVAEQRILVDPWLVGSLIFGNAPWLFRGERSVTGPIPDDVNILLLSQGLEDHAHPSTLQALDKSIPVIGSPNAAKVARQFGFRDVTALAHGEESIRRGLTIKALPGTPMGPTLQENAYVLTEQASGLKLFYEPHGFHEDDLRAESPVDVVITPMADISLPLVGTILRGRDSAQELADWLQPQVMLSTANAGETEYRGFLVSLLQVTGGVEELRRQLVTAGSSIQVVEPKVGDRCELPLIPRSVTA